MFTIVAMKWFPFTEFDVLSDEPKALVDVKDSLDIMMLRALSKALNFT